jgi:NADPH-dependent ferric siderophore reductase
MAMANHLLTRAGSPAPHVVWRGDVEAGSPLPYFREMRVVRRHLVTPHMQRLTLTGTNLARFATNGLHVRLHIPRRGSLPAPWPVMGEDGRPDWPDGMPKPFSRAYTIRRIDVEAGEVDIDFVLHDGDNMPGADFARSAVTGDVVGMTGPGGGNVGKVGWYLLAGDETALPAIARILESLPASARAVVRIEVGGEEERQNLVSPAQTDIAWLLRGDRAAGTTSLLPDAVHDVIWPDDPVSVFAWAGCEHAAARRLRAFFRENRGLTREQHLCAAYWRRGVSADKPRERD